MAINNISTPIKDSMCDTFTAFIDTGGAAGTIAIYTSGFGTLLATLTFSATAFGAAANGVCTAAAITSDSSADATGTAAVCRVSSGGSPVTLFEGTVGTSGADVNFNTVSFTAGDSVAISSMSITFPAS